MPINTGLLIFNSKITSRNDLMIGLLCAISALVGNNINKLEESIVENFQSNILQDNRNVGVKTYGN